MCAHVLRTRHTPRVVLGILARKRIVNGVAFIAVIAYNSRMSDSSKQLIFLGSRSAMKKLIWMAHENGYEVLGMLDHQYINDPDAEQRFGLPVIGSEQNLLDHEWLHKMTSYGASLEFFVAPIFVGTNFESWQRRTEMIRLVNLSGVKCANLIDPYVRILPDVTLGRNVSIEFGCFIDCDCVIGDFTTLGPGAGIGDHVTVGSNCCIGPHTCLGTGVVIKDNVCTGVHSGIGRVGDKPAVIGANSIVASAVAVYRDVAENSIVLPNGKIISNTKTNLQQLDNTLATNLSRVPKISA